MARNFDDSISSLMSKNPTLNARIKHLLSAFDYTMVLEIFFTELDIDLENGPT